MTEELRTPNEEPKLLAAEHGGFFFVLPRRSESRTRAELMGRRSP